MSSKQSQDYSVLFESLHMPDEKKEDESVATEMGNNVAKVEATKKTTKKRSPSKVRTTLYLSKDDHRWLRIYCLQNEMTISDVMLMTIKRLRKNSHEK